MLHYLIFPEMMHQYKHSIISIIDPPIFNGQRTTYEYSFDTTDPDTLKRFIAYVDERTIWNRGDPIWDKEEALQEEHPEDAADGMAEAYLSNIESLLRIRGQVYLHTFVGIHQLNMLVDKFGEELALDVIDTEVPADGDQEGLRDCAEVLRELIAKYDFTYHKWRGGYEGSKVLKRYIRDSGYQEVMDEIRKIRS